MRTKKCNCSKTKKHYDYIIVGLGTAGAVLARKLSDNFKNRVLVLEIGRNRTEDPAVKSPTPISPPFANDLTFNPKYAVTYAVPTYPTTTLSIQDWYPAFLQAITYSEGRMWGGGSAHNYLAAVRGTPPIYDQWAAISGNSQWTYNNLLPIMKKIETYTPNGTALNPAQRGTNGPIYITQAPPVTTETVAQAIQTATLTPFTNDYNDPTEGLLSVSANQSFITPGPNSERSYSIPAYLPIGEIIDAQGNGLHGRQLKIKSAALVSKILFDGTTAVGVEYIKNHGAKNSTVDTVFASKKIILCAGSINSPAILQRSGVGPTSVLDELNIPIIVNSPQVGRNLINHYGPIGTVVNVPQFTPSTAIAFVNGAPYLPNDQVRRLEIIPQFLAPTVFNFLGFIIDIASRGSVKIVDTNAIISPKVDLNMYSDPADAAAAVAFYRLLADISANLPGSVVVYPTPANYLSDAGLLSAAKNISTSAVADHVTGTNRMGKTINDGVVDGNLHVFGTSNLMIVDLSVAPVINNGNTAFPVYVIAEVASKILTNEGQFCHCKKCEKPHKKRHC